MGKINKELFEKVFGDGKLDVTVKERHPMSNPTVPHKNKKKDKSKNRCRTKSFE